MRILLAAVVCLVVVGTAHAQRQNHGGKVVHTRMAPVMVHRALPPYGLGVHVYERQPAAPAAKR